MTWIGVAWPVLAACEHRAEGDSADDHQERSDDKRDAGADVPATPTRLSGQTGPPSLSFFGFSRQPMASLSNQYPVSLVETVLVAPRSVRCSC